MSKSVIINNLKEDLRRINENIKMYKKKIEKYPQGYLREKKINGKSYYYLRKRYGDKIKDKYVKKEDVEDIKMGVKKRRFIEENLKRLIEQKRYIEKILKNK